MLCPLRNDLNVRWTELYRWLRNQESLRVLSELNFSTQRIILTGDQKYSSFWLQILAVGGDMSIPGRALFSHCPGSPVGPLWRETPVSKAFLCISFRVPPRPPCRSPINRRSLSKALLHLSVKVLGKTSPFPGSPALPLNWGLPVSRALLCLSLGVPNKQGLLIKSQLPDSPVTEPPLHVLPSGPLSRRSVSRARGLFIHSFIYSYESPVKKLSNETEGKMWSPSTESQADGRPTFNGVRPGSQKG